MDFKQNQKINQVTEKTLLLVSISLSEHISLALWMTADECSKNHSLYLNLEMVLSFSINGFGSDEGKRKNRSHCWD